MRNPLRRPPSGLVAHRTDRSGPCQLCHHSAWAPVDNRSHGELAIAYVARLLCHSLHRKIASARHATARQAGVSGDDYAVQHCNPAATPCVTLRSTRHERRTAMTEGRGLMPLRTNNPDVVVVGGGIAGASIATVLARGGAEVLLLERQRGYRDRVRGEYMAPWGVLEARALGLEDVIRSTHAADARYMVPYDELSDPSVAEKAKRDNSTFFPGVQGPLCASHPNTCQALAEGAVRSGAELVCGVAQLQVRTGKRPSITIHNWHLEGSASAPHYRR